MEVSGQRSEPLDLRMSFKKRENDDNIALDLSKRKSSSDNTSDKVAPLDLSMKNKGKKRPRHEAEGAARSGVKRIKIGGGGKHLGSVGERPIYADASPDEQPGSLDETPGPSDQDAAKDKSTPYTIAQRRLVKKWKSGVEEKTYQVTFDEEKAGVRLVDVQNELTSMFDDIVDIAAKNYDKNDKARMTISHKDLDEDVFVHLQDVENLTGKMVMDRFARVLNSHQEISIDQTFTVSIGLMRLGKGGGGRTADQEKGRKRSGKTLHLFPHLNNTPHSAIISKASIVNILCDDDNSQICAAKSIVVCIAKLDKMRASQFDNLVAKTRQLTNGPKGLKRRALTLQAKTGLCTTRPVTVGQLALFEEHVDAKINVINFVEGCVEPVVTQCSDKVFDREIFLYLTDGHYYPVVNVDGMFPGRKVCRQCYVIYQQSKANEHPCNSSKCFVCERRDCVVGESVFCPDCNFSCRSQQCFDAHKEKVVVKGNHKVVNPVCGVRTKCLDCGKVIRKNVQNFADHVCGTYKCAYCKEWVEGTHLCYLRRKAVQKTSGLFLFFDFECMQDSIFQCREGYKVKQGCAGGCGVTGPNRETPCTADDMCGSCRLCQNCRKSHCGRNVHQPNMVVVESCCDMCKDEVLLEGSTCTRCGDLCVNCLALGRDFRGEGSGHCQLEGCGLRRRVFKGLDTVYDFCSWLVTPAHKSFTCLAHNGKSYDFCFILNYLVTEARITPECIYAGSKLMSMEVKNGLNIKFIDSINFMNMSLKKLPSCFGLKPEQLGLGDEVRELSKSDFPHAFNTRENQDYSGSYPPLEMYYGMSASQEERDRLALWHSEQQGKIFDMQEQLLKYCILDTSILRLACMTFRQLIIDITSLESEDGEITYVDCFSHLTIASTVMQIFRLNYIEEYYDVTLSDGRSGRASFKSGKWTFEGEGVSEGEIASKQFISSNIAQTPAQGYVRNSNHSAKSIAWLEWESKKLGREIVHARNRGEKEIMCGSSRYKVDGYDPVGGAVWEYYGCRFHGHNCMDMNKVVDPRTGFTMRDLHNQTVKRAKAIEAKGYKIKSIYECQFDRMIKNNKDLQDFINNQLDVPKRMTIREAFYGGRTSGFKLHHACDPGEEVHYIDVCSLYPFINKTAPMPVGHPKIITRDFDMTMQSYFGLAHVKILPPKTEYIPTLPCRMHGKLTFPLCRTCAQEECQTECTHCDADRAITGVWCTPEIIEALARGYKMITVYEVYHYDEKSHYDPVTGEGGLFAAQTDLFLKIKAEASGYPSWVVTESDKDAHIASFRSKTGVTLDKGKIEVNPALRSISKIGLNSFWGKLGQRGNKVKTMFITKVSELTKLVNNGRNNLINFHIINEDVMVIEYNRTEDFEEESNVTNEVLAAFTTCFARLELLKHMTVVGSNILYCDTDSLIFVTRKSIGADGTVSYSNFPETGDSLGELTNELPPNTYIKEFICAAPKSYSYRTSDNKEVCKFKGVTLNGKNCQRVNFQAVKDLVFGVSDSISLQPQTQFKRSKFEGVITNVPLVKTVVPTYNKRRILPNLDTVPFGYVSHDQDN